LLDGVGDEAFEPSTPARQHPAAASEREQFEPAATSTSTALDVQSPEIRALKGSDVQMRGENGVTYE